MADQSWTPIDTDELERRAQLWAGRAHDYCDFAEEAQNITRRDTRLRQAQIYATVSQAYSLLAIARKPVA